MTQYNTNMSEANYYAYCAAWCVCFHQTLELWDDTGSASRAVRAGIVFG